MFACPTWQFAASAGRHATLHLLLLPHISLCNRQTTAPNCQHSSCQFYRIRLLKARAFYDLPFFIELVCYGVDQQAACCTLL